MSVATEPQTFQDIEDLYCGSVFPNMQRFKGGTALCLFTAEWLGRQDVYWIARARLTGTCVDHNAEKLERMRELYPNGWEFVAGDVYEYVSQALADGRQWDVVTLDPWTSQFSRCAEMLDTWTTLARKVVVMGFGNYKRTPPDAPEGWTRTHQIMRSDFRGGVWWLVYERQ